MEEAPNKEKVNVQQIPRLYENQEFQDAYEIAVKEIIRLQDKYNRGAVDRLLQQQFPKIPFETMESIHQNAISFALSIG